MTLKSKANSNRRTAASPLLRQIQEIDRQIYNLAKADYNAAKISPPQFLPKEKAWLEQRLGLERKKQEVEGLEMEVIARVKSTLR